MTQFNPGDRVRHEPSGEEWILYIVYGSYVVPEGWPPTQALAADCTLLERDDTCTCTTAEERAACVSACDEIII